MKIVKFLVVAVFFNVILGCATVEPPPPPPPPDGEPQCFSERPLEARQVSVPLGDGLMHLFKNANYKGSSVPLRLTDHGPGVLLDNLGKVKDEMSSLRWNLPRGVVVVFYQHFNGTGRQLVIWGTGEYPSISRWNMNDSASRWAWYYVGGRTNPPPEIEKALAERPWRAQEPSQPVEPETIYLFEDAAFGGDREAITPVTGKSANQYNPVGETFDRMSSVLWDLPPGLVVLLHQHRAGSGDMIVLWGRGQYDRVKPLGFNDRISRWSWYCLGDGAPNTD